MRMIALCVLMLHLSAAAMAQAQTPDDLEISVLGYTVADDGGENRVVGMSTGKIVIGKATPAAFSFADCGYFMVSAGHSMERATAGWRVEFTPIRVNGDAVTFRLHWVRSVDTTKAARTSSEDVELTLRPGQSRPLDIVTVSPEAKASNGGRCKVSAGSLRVVVDYFPSDDYDRRLILADLWLVERLSNGTERSQPLSVRGLPSRPVPFYFDSIVDGSVSLEIFGRVIARPDRGTIDLSVETRSRWGEATEAQNYKGAGRLVESALRIKPDEIVEMRLPRLSIGPFSNRDFSIRIRARQLR